MRALVTGGTGFIGPWVVERLLERGEAVTLLGDFGINGGNVEELLGRRGLRLVDGDVRDRLSVGRAAEGCDATIHLAAIVGESRAMREPDMAFSVNVTGTLNVLEAARSHGHSRFVYSSSVAAYGTPSRLPIHEDSTLQPLGLYGASKLAGEDLVNAYHAVYGLCTTALRFFNVYGPGQSGGSDGVIQRFFQDSSDTGAITICGEGAETRDFVYVEDVADAVLLALDSQECGAFNVGTGKATSIRELVEAFVRLRPGLRLLHGSAGRNSIVSGQASTARAASVLGWRAKVKLGEGLERCLEHIRLAEHPKRLV